MNSKARAYAISRLAAAPDLAALQAVWQSFGITYQRDPEVFRFKELMKAKLGSKP